MIRPLGLHSASIVRLRVVETSGIIGHHRHNYREIYQIKPPQGFGESVNKYLNHFINVADAKGAGLLTADLAIGGYLIPNAPMTLGTQLSHWACLFFLTTSGILALLALYPRASRIGSSLIFWEDIQARPTVDDYLKDLSHVDDMEIERQYGAQNYLVSGILSAKYGFVRRSMWCLLAAMLLLAIRLWGA